MKLCCLMFLLQVAAPCMTTKPCEVPPDPGAVVRQLYSEITKVFQSVRSFPAGRR